MFLRAWLLSSINTNMVVMLVDQLFNLDAHHEKVGNIQGWKYGVYRFQFFIYIYILINLTEKRGTAMHWLPCQNTPKKKKII